MDEKNNSWIKKNWIKLYLAFIILIFIIGIVGTVWDFVSYANGEKTEATVTEVVNKRKKSGARKQTSYKVTKVKIRYKVDENEYNRKIELKGWYKLKKGDNLKVSYDPKNPNKVIIPQRLKQDLKYDILLGLFAGAQLVIVIKYGKNNKKQKRDEV
ncbi:MAG: DUF3592 domain-containing protein [Lachnospiraceae bacterium]|nr:DUF3592 domain-containing protein [Lachnospiraceae bacterium]